MTIETLNHETVLDKSEALAALINRQTDGEGNGAHATVINPLTGLKQMAVF